MKRKSAAASFGILAAGLVSSIGVSGMGVATAQTALRGELVMSGLNQPLDVQSTPAFPEYIYIVERIEPEQDLGRIRWKNVKTGATGVFFETPEEVWRGGERGLLSMAWDPDAAENGFFYVNYNDASGANLVVRFHANSATSGDAASRRLILQIEQTFLNHQAHWLGFGPDKYLYIAAGDGGGVNDPNNRAQTITNEWHGKILRVDPHEDGFPLDVLRNYRVPPENPFVGVEGDDEIWAYGLRNPWRNTFDPLTGDFYIADVGQGAWEEINFEFRFWSGGTNYGWRCWEGNHRSAVDPCDSPQGAAPKFEYPHTGDACAITGGVVYRGPDPDLYGRYFFGDLCSGQIWSLRMVNNAATDVREHTLTLPDGLDLGSIVSFGVDQLGSMYVVDHADGEVFRFVPTQGVTNDCNANGFDDRAEIDLGMTTDVDGGPTGVPAAGATTFAADCASCHGNSGNDLSPSIRNTGRARLWDVLLNPSTHAGGLHPEYSQQDFANIEAHLSDLGTRSRPDAIPDACQTLPDCDRDGVPDAGEFAAGTQRDLGFDGLPDECVETALSPSAGANGNVHAAFVRPDGVVVELTRKSATGQWLVVEYNDLGAPEALRAESFVDSKDGRVYVAAASRSGLHLVSPEIPGDNPRDLTAEIPGSTAIIGATTTFTSLDGLTFVAGIDAAGDLVMYFQTGQMGAGGREIWSFTNLYRDHLEVQGMVKPAFSGELVSYVTPWNGLNIAGLDAAGTIWSVWWAPSLTLWQSSNLSAITGAEPIVGKLTAYVTSWGGINLAGLNAGGEVVVTWWVPQFGGEWAKSNLSQQFGHPGLKVGELTSYVTPWGGLNVAGLDSGGQLVIYWWSPGMNDWVVSPLSALIPGAPLPASSVRGVAAPTGLLSVFAFTAEGEGGGGAGAGDVIRYFWQPDGAWQVENVSQAAVPR